MPTSDLRIDYANVLDAAVGPQHGLSLAEIKRAEAGVSRIVAQVEQELAAGKHRYRTLPADRAMLRQVQAAARKHRPGCENLVVLGIGGSALGNIALQTALNSTYYNLLPARQRGGPRLFVMDNVDPVQFGNLLGLLGPSLRKTKFNVISKSGETAETAAQFLIVRDVLARKLGARALPRQIIITTDPQEGALRKIADAGGYDTLPVPAGVGGRFTALAPVGLFSAAMCGIDVAKLLAGAARMNQRVGAADVRKNPAALLALVLYEFYTRGKRLHVMMSYSDQLRDFADWYRQLWAESLGKQRDVSGAPTVVGPTPIRAVGATDQHSQVQLYREGPNDKVFIFLEVGRFERDVKIPRDKHAPASSAYLCGASLGRLLSAEKLATEFALVSSQRPCLTIRFPRVDAHAVGQFILLWEAATTIMGALLNIDPYDQPAVQMGKDMTFAGMGRRGYEAQARELRRFADRAGTHTV